MPVALRWVRAAARTMPAFAPEQLSEGQINELIAYLAPMAGGR